MKYNQHFKEARELFEQYGVASVWSKGEGLSGREQTLIASVCWYLEQLLPLHEENILDMQGGDVVEYMNKTLGTDFTGKNTVSWRSTILNTSLQGLERRLYTAGSVGLLR